MSLPMNSLIAVIAVAWLFSCGASLLGLLCNIRPGPRRLWVALISSCFAILVAYLGWSRLQFRASRTVNGQVEWSVDSHWFFIGALVLGALSLALTLWNWRKATVAQPPAQ
jgi:hypothetical protein